MDRCRHRRPRRSPRSHPPQPAARQPRRDPGRGAPVPRRGAATPAVGTETEGAQHPHRGNPPVCGLIPIQGTLAKRYLNHRGLRGPFPARALRYHPRCYYREHEDAPRQTWPALIAAVTDLAGTLTGVHRTWLDRDGVDKAPLVEPRRALGDLLGHAVRIGIPQRVLTAGEGRKTMLSLRTLMPAMPIAAALSANHLAALALPPRLARLYIAVDHDPAGEAAAETLKARAAVAGIEARLLIPGTEDWNSDLTGFGPERTRDRLFPQLPPDDAGRLLCPASLLAGLDALRLRHERRGRQKRKSPAEAHSQSIGGSGSEAQGRIGVSAAEKPANFDNRPAASASILLL